MRKSVPALAGLLLAVCAPAAALAADDPGTGVSIRVLPPEDPAGTPPEDPAGTPPEDRDVSPPDRREPAGYHVESGADVPRDSGGIDGIRKEIDVTAPAPAAEKITGELPFTGIDGEALTVLALAGAVASIEGVALIVLTRRRFRRAP
ncbi:hypothetical protein [Herbidospora sp. RD11066]